MTPFTPIEGAGALGVALAAGTMIWQAVQIRGLRKALRCEVRKTDNLADSVVDYRNMYLGALGERDALRAKLSKFGVKKRAPNGHFLSPKAEQEAAA